MWTNLLKCCSFFNRNRHRKSLSTIPCAILAFFLFISLVNLMRHETKYIQVQESGGKNNIEGKFPALYELEVESDHLITAQQDDSNLEPKQDLTQNQQHTDNAGLGHNSTTSSPNRTEMFENATNSMKDLQSHRLSVLKDVCENFILPSMFHEENPNMSLPLSSIWETEWYKKNQAILTRYNDIYVDDKHKMMYCNVPKVACTNLKRIFLITTGAAKTDNPESITHFDIYFGRRYARYLKQLSKYSKEDVLTRLNTYTNFVFVRNPFERMLSAYRDKFENTRAFDLYFPNQIGTHIIRKFRANATSRARMTGKDVKFHEFVQYLLGLNSDGWMNEHWRTYNYNCNPCFANFNFIGKYEHFDQEAQYLFNSLGLHDLKVPKIDTPYLDSGKNTMTTRQLLGKYFSQISKEQILALKDFYKKDLDLFEYDFPNAIEDLLKL